MTMKTHTHQRGVAAIEFAILLPLLLFIVFGITEFGRALYAYNTILKGTRDAARYAMTQNPGGGADAVTKCLAVYGTTDCSGTPLTPGLTTDAVSVCDWMRCPATHQAQGSAPVVNLVTVTVNGPTIADASKYRFESLVPFVTANVSSFTFAPISTTMKGML
jgi:Flp pilus assembly protein TadG